MYYSTHYSSPLGPLTLASDGEHLAGLWLEGQKYFGDTVSGDMDLIDGIGLTLDVSDPHGAHLTMSQAVWKILCDIPYGEVTTYGEIARKMAARGNRRSMSAQAVGGAVGHNPISIIIPCHRVVGAGGSLTGYAGGIAAKIRLLKLEGADMSRLFVPKKGTAL